MKPKKVGQVFLAGGRAALLDAATAAYRESRRATKAGDDDAQFWVEVGDFIAGYASGWPDYE